MNITINQIGHTPNSTASMLYIDNRPFSFTIEDGFRDKKVKHETRIPAGRYQIKKRTEGRFYELYKKKWGHKFVPEFVDVPGFLYILFHAGNKIIDTSGCVLPNRYVGIGTDGNYEGLDSQSVYKLLYSLIDAAFEREEEVWVDVVRFEIIDETRNIG